MSTLSLWILVVSRFAICMCAGEVAIRYAAWSWQLSRTRPPLTAAPLVVGVAFWAANRFGIELRWMLQVAQGHSSTKMLSLVDGDLASELFRLGVIVSLAFLTYPVTKIVYKQSWERAVVEMVVRLFLIGLSVLIGWSMAVVYALHGGPAI